MKPFLHFLLVGLMQLSAPGGEFSAIKTATGIRVAHNAPDSHFTIEIPGKQIEPLEHPKHFFVKADGIPIQVQSASVTEIYGEALKVSPKGLMLAHRDWETAHLEKSLGAKLQLECALVTLADGSDGLFWDYAMPKGMDAEVARQIYLTRSVGDRVLVLNAAVIKGAKPDVIRKTLLTAANSFNAQEGAVDLAKLKPSNDDRSSSPVDSGKAKDFVFLLNKRAGGIRIEGNADAPRMVFFDDAGDGVETMWETGLARQADGSWLTERGLSVRVEKLARPVEFGGKSMGWKLKISGKDPAYRELKKAMPLVDFGDAENTEFFGNQESAAGKPMVAEDQAVHTPPPGSQEHNTIVDLFLRDWYRDAKKARGNPDKIVFVVHHLKVKDGWACVNATPTQKGRKVDPPRWAIFRKTGDSWVDVHYYEKLGPYASEAEAEDALGMTPATVKRLPSKLPGCPKEILP